MVSRKPSGSGPVPVASRTNSSTTTPKSAKKPTPKPSALHDAEPATSKPDVPSVTVGSKVEPKGPEFSDTVKFFPSPEKDSVNPKRDATKVKVKSKPKKVATVVKNQANARPARRSANSQAFDHLARLFLVIFVVYSLAVCPTDYTLSSPVCRGLTAYRESVLVPYVHPPFKALVNHPVVAAQIARVQPHVNRIVMVTRPYQQRVQREWKKHVIPRWRFILRKTQPYTSRLQREYTRRVAPHVRVATYNLQRYQRRAEPYVNALTVWGKRQWKVLEPLINERILKPLVAAKETWVDPHLRRIAQQLNESGKAKEPVAAKPVEKEPEAAKPVVKVNVPPPVEKHDIEEEIIIDEEEPTTPAVTYYSTPLAPTETISEQAPEPTSEPEPAEPEPEPAAVREGNPADYSDPELEAFLASLELDKQEPPPPVEAPPVEETEEEKAERKRLRDLETAQKRANIEARHTKWEEQLAERGGSLMGEIIQKLEEFRVAKANEFDSNPEIRGYITSLEEESAKTLRHAEAFFKKLKLKKKGGAIKVALWEQFLDKVQAKYQENVNSAEKKAQDWWHAALDIEHSIIDRAAEELKDIGEAGQADLGMDYAWLDDVTHFDWTRYHKLLGDGKEFAESYRKLVDATHPAMKPHAVVPLLTSLQDEMREVMLGFETGLNKIKREGYRYFSDGEVDGEPEEASKPQGEAKEPESNDDAKLKVGAAMPIIGRSAEEVKEAIHKAEAAVSSALGSSAHHEEL